MAQGGFIVPRALPFCSLFFRHNYSTSRPAKPYLIANSDLVLLQDRMSNDMNPETNLTALLEVSASDSSDVHEGDQPTRSSLRVPRQRKTDIELSYKRQISGLQEK